MSKRLSILSAIGLCLGFTWGGTAQAQFILQPAGASTNMGGPINPPSVTINQSGLSTGYTSLVTDFDAYIGSNPSHNIIPGSTLWASAGGVTTGNFDFDLGGSFTIQSFALWNKGGGDSDNIIGFTLLADDNAVFGSPTLLGNFTANPNTGPIIAVLPEVFGFTPTEASFVRMQITSNNGATASGFGEAAFEIAAVPEPTTWALMGLGSALVVSGVWYRRRQTRQVAEQLLDNQD